VCVRVCVCVCVRACLRVCVFTVGQIQLKESKTHHFNKFEKGNRDEFLVDVDNIGELKHIRYSSVFLNIYIYRGGAKK